jgi:hypothetical protein
MGWQASIFAALLPRLYGTVKFGRRLACCANTKRRPFFGRRFGFSSQVKV